MNEKLIMLWLLFFVALISVVSAQVIITPAGNQIQNENDNNTIGNTISSLQQNFQSIQGKINNLATKSDLETATNFIAKADQTIIEKKINDAILIIGILVFFMAIGSFCTYFILKGRGVV